MTLKHGQYSHQHTLCCQVVEVPPPPVAKVVDTTGAGDAFLGGLIVGEPLLPENESYSIVQWIEKSQLKRNTHKEQYTSKDLVT